ncbi:hypothetical protein FA10DRAFT_266566 [Acaromyces ingoldii]|uniref:Uncharacterized protein n=1 Tax=Acaromyces ingoldii TaxID=215250 RepID=A0A316YPS5_9BASI|nr:hypothetical protein FA10DRAFT_266566 [Acaromyces ingoldii]PWN90053.1 hypothetical protein FA10DRAFT_266566 [Acaromyces ingoldii]
MRASALFCTEAAGLSPSVSTLSSVDVQQLSISASWSPFLFFFLLVLSLFLIELEPGGAWTMTSPAYSSRPPLTIARGQLQSAALKARWWETLSMWGPRD